MTGINDIRSEAAYGLSRPDGYVCADGMAAPVWTREVAAALQALTVRPPCSCGDAYMGGKVPPYEGCLRHSAWRYPDLPDLRRVEPVR